MGIYQELSDRASKATRLRRAAVRPCWRAQLHHGLPVPNVCTASLLHLLEQLGRKVGMRVNKMATKPNVSTPHHATPLPSSLALLSLARLSPPTPHSIHHSTSC